jgi:hypothetical protein
MENGLIALNFTLGQLIPVLKSVAFNFKWIEFLKDIKYHFQNPEHYQEYLASIPPVRKYKTPSEQ